MVKEIIHYTSKTSYDSIQSHGFIELEAFNIESASITNPTDSPSYDPNITFEKLWNDLKKQMKHTGRYVWFTEEDTCSCISQLQSYEKIAIRFNPNDINAEKWVDVADRMMFKSNKAKKLIRVLNNNAIQNGDDISKWWVCRERVDINLAIT